MSINLRPHTKLVFGCVAVFGCLLTPARHTAVLSLACVSMFAPAEKYMARARRAIAFNLQALLSWRHTARENRNLRDRVDKLRELLEMERARSAEKDQRFQTLNKFVTLQQNLKQNLVAREAEVIGEGAGAQSGLLFIDCGSRDKISKGMVVVAGRSIVGKVRAVSPRGSSGSLATSAGSQFDGQIVSTGERGIVVGNGDGTMTMKYVSKTKPQPGAAVTTRGRDGITPEHFLLGLVADASRRPGSLTYDVTLRPARELDRLVSVIAVKPPISTADFPGHPERDTGEDD